MTNVEAGGATSTKSWRNLLLAKLVYFFVFAADASWEPFAAYFLSTRNIQTKTIGVLLYLGRTQGWRAGQTHAAPPRAAEQ